MKVNIECNHATLAGHSFEHEVALATALGCFGSVDANRGDSQNGWDTDQFPNDAGEAAQALYHVLKAGGLTQGGFNFDAKIRRQSVNAVDLVHVITSYSIHYTKLYETKTAGKMEGLMVQTVKLQASARRRCVFVAVRVRIFCGPSIT